MESAAFYYLNERAKRAKDEYRSDHWESGRAEFVRVVTALKDGMERGEFFPRPSESRCAHCASRAACGTGQADAEVGAGAGTDGRVFKRCGGRMTTKPLIDAAARERAQNDLSTTYLVEAAAGTGKTTLLVSRILTIVRETLTPLSRVAAITFTEKAAGELKIKLRERLEAGARGTGEEAEQYRKALADIDLMPVSTIHAFCRDLIAQRPVEAGSRSGLRAGGRGDLADAAGRMLAGVGGGRIRDGLPGGAALSGARAGCRGRRPFAFHAVHAL